MWLDWPRTKPALANNRLHIYHHEADFGTVLQPCSAAARGPGLIARATELPRQRGFHEDEMVAQFRRCFVVGRDLLESERAV